MSHGIPYSIEIPPIWHVHTRGQLSISLRNHPLLKIKREKSGMGKNFHASVPYLHAFTRGANPCHCHGRRGFFSRKKTQAKKGETLFEWILHFFLSFPYTYRYIIYISFFRGAEREKWWSELQGAVAENPLARALLDIGFYFRFRMLTRRPSEEKGINRRAGWKLGKAISRKWKKWNGRWQNTNKWKKGIWWTGWEGEIKL